MADAHLWTILESVQANLRSQVEFTTQPEDTIPRIKESAIVIRKYGRGRKGESPFSGEEKPGLIITPPRSWGGQEGENLRDDVQYPVLIQCITGDQEGYDRNLRTLLKWQEQIVKLFRHQRLAGASTVTECNAYVQDVIDEKLFLTDHQLFVFGVVCNFRSREQRGVS